MKNLSIYIHIPFCRHKCIYCDFYSITNDSKKEEYLEAIFSEIEHFAFKYSDNRIISTIFFGGGTPSLMPPKYIESILTKLKQHFEIDSNVEITIEANPGTLFPDNLYEFRNIGINRLSIGIQSFDDSDLKFLTRIHDEKTAIESVILAQKSGFRNINIDLIFNLPIQKEEKWIANLLKSMLLQRV